LRNCWACSLMLTGAGGRLRCVVAVASVMTYSLASRSAVDTWATAQ
jgi:hypothetical protein